ncbi:hypothetical protein SNK04_008749 [Fusarium graminearum]
MARVAIEDIVVDREKGDRSFNNGRKYLSQTGDCILDTLLFSNGRQNPRDRSLRALSSLKGPRKANMDFCQIPHFPVST